MKPLNRNFLKIEENSKFGKNRRLLIHNVASRCELKNQNANLTTLENVFALSLVEDALHSSSIRKELLQSKTFFN